MKVLLTGAFGNVGTSTLDELLRAGHQVRCFDVPTRANRKKAARYGQQIEVVWGDLREPSDVSCAVVDQDAAIHLAFIIPSLSVTGRGTEDRPDWARGINVGGTRNLLEALKAQPSPPRIIFSSSLHVYGRTQDCTPPRTPLDTVDPIEHYSLHKIECEGMVKASGLEWLIMRFAAVLPLAIKLDPAMYDVPLYNRMEYVHTRDVGLALANAVVSPDVWGKTLLIGGGPSCQYYYREIVEAVLGAAGIGMLPEEAFSTVQFCTDWLDTTESERLLHYQRYTLADYAKELTVLLGERRRLARLFQPIARA